MEFEYLIESTLILALKSIEIWLIKLSYLSFGPFSFTSLQTFLYKSIFYTGQLTISYNVENS